MGRFTCLNLNSRHTKKTTIMWAATFKAFDKDGSGAIDKAEFTAALAAHGSAGKADEYFGKFDKDNSGSIDATEFAAMCEAAVEKAFAKIDADKSGNVSPAEIKAACGKADATAFVAVADKDGDGEVSKTEFAAALASNPKFLPIL